MLKVAIIGYGNFGKKRASAINNIKELKLSAIIDPFYKGNTKTQSILGSIDQLEENIDVFFICTPNNLHLQYCRQLISKNVIIICEKPLCVTNEEINELEKLLPKYQSSIFMGSNLSYFPSFIQLQSYLMKENLNTFKKIECSIGTKNRAGLSDWALEKDIAGGGTLLDNGIHIIQYLNSFLDDLKPIHVELNSKDIESSALVKASANNCQDISIKSSWERNDDIYADIKIILDDDTKIIVNAFNDFITIDEKVLKSIENTHSIEKEITTIIELRNSKKSNFVQAKKSLKFVFDCYNL